MQKRLGSHAVTAAACAVPCTMAGREQQLAAAIETCAEGPMLAGLLTELAGLRIAAGRMDEAGGLLQQAYALRMKALTASCAEASNTMLAASTQQPPQQQQQQQPQQEQQQQQQQQQRPQQLQQHHQQQEGMQPEQQLQQQMQQHDQQLEQHEPQQLEQQHQQPQQQELQQLQQHQQQLEQQERQQLYHHQLQQQQQQQQQEQRHQQQLGMLRHQQPASSSDCSDGSDSEEGISPAAPQSSSSQQSAAADHVITAAGSIKASVEQQVDDQRLNEDGNWDKSDDWEPDLSSLQTANSFEHNTQQRQPQQASQGPTPGRLPASKADSADWWRPSSSGGSNARASSQPRGRGESKCGAASDADSDSGWDVAGVTNQPHILEIFNLNRSVKTGHIEEFLLEFMWGGTTANVKWVDDEHALAVFPCAEAAQVLLDSSQKEFKVRPYNKASGAALQIAADELLPPRSARPKTTTAVARRLISNALGNREVRDKAAERELADMRKANKVGKQQRQQQLNEAWGDD